MELRKYGADALFFFPLVDAGAVDFVSGPTIAAGDAKLFTDNQISTNTAAEVVAFTSGSEEPANGDTLVGATSASEATFMFAVVTSGTWGGGDAAGFLFLKGLTGALQSENLNISGGTSNVATIGGDSTAGLFASLGNGNYAIALTATEMQCTLGSIHIIDSATKEWEDQAIHFMTFGNASAMLAFDLSNATPTVDMSKISGDSTAADNLEAALDGTGGVTLTTAITGNISGNLSGSVGSVTGAVGSVTGAVGSVTGNVGGNVVGSTASVTGAVGSVTGSVGGDVAGKVLGGGAGSISGDGVQASSVTGAVGSVTGAVGSVTGAVGSVTGNVGGNVTGSVGSLATQAKADVDAEVDEAIVNYHLDHLFAATYDPSSKPGAADALLNELVENDGGVARYTTNALEQAPGGGASITNYVSVPAATLATLNSRNHLTITRYSTLSAGLTGLGSVANKSATYFMIKEHLSDADTSALVWIDEATGLIRINGSTDGVTAGSGNINWTNTTTGAVTITLQEAETGLLTARKGLHWSLKVVRSTGVVEELIVPSGKVDVLDGVIRAVS